VTIKEQRIAQIVKRYVFRNFSEWWVRKLKGRYGGRCSRRRSAGAGGRAGEMAMAHGVLASLNGEWTALALMSPKLS
jgi:hypothetical protein